MSAGTRERGRSGLRSAVLGLRFLTELTLLAALTLAGLNAAAGTAARIALAVAGPVVAAGIWAIGIAPRARHRWPDPWRIGAEVVLFGAAAAGLIADTGLAWGIAFAVVSVGTAFAVRVLAPGG